MRVDEHTIDLAGSPAFYRSAPGLAADGALGGGVPLYLHGLPTSSADWVTFLQRSGGLAPDLLGFGRTAKAGHLDYSIDGLADFVERFLAAVGVDRVQLVAHDWGAAAGLVFAQRHPGRVGRLVLVNPLPLFDDFQWPALARLWRRPLLGELAMGSITRRLLARWLRRGAVAADAWPTEAATAVWEQFDQGTQRAILRLHRDAGPQRLAAAGAQLERLTMPALVVWGTRDPWLPPSFGEAYARRLADARLELVADAGHWPWLDRPDLTGRVASFLGAEQTGA